jgi:hypothetical protein
VTYDEPHPDDGDVEMAETEPVPTRRKKAASTGDE